MDNNTDNIDNDQEMMALNFATRLILSDFDKSVMIERSLESLVDFGCSERAGFFLMDPFDEVLNAEGVIIENVYAGKALKIDWHNAPFNEIIKIKKPVFFNLDYQDEIPIPAVSGGKSAKKCLCIPLIAADNRNIGLVTLEYNEDITIESIYTQHMVLLLTIISMGIENVRLFHLAVNDGLTNLYVRRYFDIRLREETTRIKRYGGKMSLLVVDIDNFKKFNDTHGHQQGDIILKEVAKIMQRSVRISLDVVCRYGGEEFVIIMPNTDLDGSVLTAERIRKTCQDYAFPGNGTSLNVTLSGGIAFIDNESLISEDEIFKRADKALYQSKQNGRNQINVWKQ